VSQRTPFKAWAQGVATAWCVPLLLLLLWEACARAAWVSPIVMPAPSAVAVRWWQWAVSGELLQDAAASLYRVLLGFGLGAALALPLGLWMGATPRALALLNPLLQILRPIPPIAYIPLSILWFGLGNPPAVFLIALGAFFPVWMNTMAGVRQVDGIYLRVARNLGATRWPLFTRVILPAATPYILSGVRIGMGTAFIVVIVSEMIAVNNGLGFRILEAREFMWSDKIIAGMLTIGLLGLLIDTGISRLNAHVLRWHRGLEH
jgi:NitT/TauT family transport system permease protein